MKHSLTGGSNASIWWYCPGSVYLNKVVPVIENDAMRKGTELHEEAHLVLTGQADAKSKVVKDYIAMLPEDWSAGLWGSEMEVHHSNHTFAFGTIDMYWKEASGKNHVCDLKTGLRPVDVTNNEQLLTYAYWLSPERPVVHIAQPKVNSRLQTWEPTEEEWESAKRKIDWALDSVYAGPVVLKTGKHCARCRAKDFCPQKKAEHASAIEGW